ncbi:hypothetical protein K8O92_31110 [Nocardia asteroides]|nr:hypothetical protein K8O92_31110 [Nocardia asteroides]
MHSGYPRTVKDFEIHQLMRMRCSDDVKLAKLEAYGVTLQEAERIADKVSRMLPLGRQQFLKLQELIGVHAPGASTVRCVSAFWPQFEFVAEGTDFGAIGDAQFRRISGSPPAVDEPTELPPWSVTVDEFEELFGPLSEGEQWLPNSEYLFERSGRTCVAAFGWGLLLEVVENPTAMAKPAD